jgi:hypothetical protein
MAQRIQFQILRATSANRTSYTPAEGELLYTTDTQNLYIGDGSTAGGLLLISSSGTVSSGANVGNGGVGPFKQISSGEIQFKNINAASSRISVTDDPGNDEIDIDVVEGSINHDALLNFLANEHIDHSTVNVIAGTGLTGGGDITADRTLDLADTAVTPGTYADNNSVVQITVDQQGRITAASNVDIDHDQLTNFDADEHRPLDDTSTTTTNLWSADKIQSELDDKLGETLSLNTQTGNYTVQTSDAATKILMNNGSSATVTLPNGFPTGFQVIISRISTGLVTIAADGTLLSQGTQLDLENTGCVATHIGSNEWLVEGRLV